MGNVNATSGLASKLGFFVCYEVAGLLEIDVCIEKYAKVGFYVVVVSGEVHLYICRVECGNCLAHLCTD